MQKASGGASDTCCLGQVKPDAHICSRRISRKEFWTGLNVLTCLNGERRPSSCSCLCWWCCYSCEQIVAWGRGTSVLIYSKVLCLVPSLLFITLPFMTGTATTPVMVAGPLYPSSVHPRCLLFTSLSLIDKLLPQLCNINHVCPPCSSEAACSSSSFSSSSEDFKAIVVIFSC